MEFGRLPISPRPAEPPVIPVERWMKSGDVLIKTYRFRRPGDRERFVGVLFCYEREVQHNATMTLTQEEVTVCVQTHGIGVTELDYEYARFADQVFKDVVYSRDQGVYDPTDV